MSCDSLKVGCCVRCEAAGWSNVGTGLCWARTPWITTAEQRREPADWERWSLPTSALSFGQTSRHTRRRVSKANARVTALLNPGPQTHSPYKFDMFPCANTPDSTHQHFIYRRLIMIVIWIRCVGAGKHVKHVKQRVWINTDAQSKDTQMGQIRSSKMTASSVRSQVRQSLMPRSVGKILWGCSWKVSYVFPFSFPKIKFFSVSLGNPRCIFQKQEIPWLSW